MHSDNEMVNLRSVIEILCYMVDEDSDGVEEIMQLPTIDIVRCKECKHNPWDFDRTDYTCVWDDDFADRPQTPDDFCSYGEREGE